MLKVQWFAVLLVLTSLTTVAAAQGTGDADREPVLVVSGQGEVQAEPDRAIIRFGAVAESSEAAAAQERVNEIMQDAIEAVGDVGIARNRISTSNLTLSPIYEQKKTLDGRTHQQIRGYRASYTLTVVADEIAQAGAVIDAGLSSGINEFHGIHFALKDDTQAKRGALEQAAGQARVKAEAIAAAMGVRLAGVQRIEEGGSHYPPPRSIYTARALMAAEMDTATPIEAGELTIIAAVTVTYRIEAAP